MKVLRLCQDLLVFSIRDAPQLFVYVQVYEWEYQWLDVNILLQNLYHFTKSLMTPPGLIYSCGGFCAVVHGQFKKKIFSFTKHTQLKVSSMKFRWSDVQSRKSILYLAKFFDYDDMIPNDGWRILTVYFWKGLWYNENNRSQQWRTTAINKYAFHLNVLDLIEYILFSD